jgi:ornithine cyclodeaminase/alanine dehydrogenase-like protein (mu-crystallin family)
MASSDNLFVLGNSDVHDLLINLTREEILEFRDLQSSCLLEVALGQERTYQPEASIINRPEGQKILFRPFTSPDGAGAKIIVTPKPAPAGQKQPVLNGIITICDDLGRPTGIINGKEVTGYRTTMSVMIPYMWRRNTSSIVIFGAGLQALWHTRLALALRGSEIETITIVNRSASSAEELVAQINEENAARWKSPAKLQTLDYSKADYNAQLRSLLSKASVVFCTVGTTEPVFPASYITDRLQGDGEAPYISGVGSWQATLQEIDPELIQYAAQRSSKIDFAPRGVDKAHVKKSGAMVADDRRTSMMHAGEVVRSKLAPEQILEVGDLVDRQRKGTLSAEVQEWMAAGLLVYKSIGVSLTDLVAGQKILGLAKKKKLGTVINNF